MKIGIANDSSAASEALRRALVHEPEHEVIWLAPSGEEAVRLCASATPDVVLMDLLMPGIGGVEATRQIMLRSPCAILIATGDLRGNVAKVFEAMGHGALDAVEVPALGSNQRTSAEPLLAKLRTIGRLIGDPARRARRTHVPSAEQVPLIAIGASAGGPAAIARVLSGLSSSIPAAVVIVQHVDAHFAQAMADWLTAQSAWPVRIAQEGDQPTPGSALLAGTSDHLIFKSSTRLGYTQEPTDYAYRPSVDVFFHSLVREWKGSATGVLLTGMGRDGAEGLRAMRDKGHHTIAQDEASSAVYGMPKAAVRLQAALDILSLADIGPRLETLFSAPLSRRL